ncbi:hypothetical protein ElyMa_001665100 [Elysia marginata]|uniref:Uncharacterized protein n=1 Tax=Elysia marginata TaxID=1093978 RepID=A0AAV4JS00_9GAST|nr:hypothetical protein ElyMa_001665100 [Elysia marginata]
MPALIKSLIVSNDAEAKLDDLNLKARPAFVKAPQHLAAVVGELASVVTPTAVKLLKGLVEQLGKVEEKVIILDDDSFYLMDAETYN